jgi:Protein of unknown function (DUF1570)
MDDAGARRRKWLGWLVVATGLVAGPSARADLIYFRGGSDAQLPATSDGNRIVLILPDGKLELQREDIVKRVPGFWPADEWEARRREARGAGFGSRYAAAWWAIENGLTEQAATEVRELHAVDPKHGPTARMAAALDRLDRPCPDPDTAAFRAALGVETKVARGPHVLLLHQHSDAEAAERIAVLERVTAGFHLLLAAQGVELRVPRHRLVSAWFADRKDYLAFLHRQGADAFATTSGYFHPTWDAVVACDARSTDKQRAARAALATRREELRRYSEMLDQMPPRNRLRLKLGDEPARTVGRADGRALIDRMEREVSYRTALLDLDWRSSDLGLAAHEMVHQLTSDSGLVTEHGVFPIWLHEGFAAQFELIRGGRWAGISRVNDLRLPDWRGLRPPARLERLVRDAGFGHGYQRDLYAQAWSLVYYLRTRHSGEFLTFLDLLRNPQSVPGSSDEAAGDATPVPRSERVIVAFRRAFGNDLDALDRDWHQYMAGIRTPLEQHAPRPGEPSSTRPGRPVNRAQTKTNPP